MLRNTQNKRTIAVNGDDVRVAARRTVLTHQTTVEDGIGNRFEVQLFRQVVVTEPARFYGFHASSLLSTRQRYVVVACRVAHFLLQRVVRIQRFLLLHFRGDIIANVSQRFSFSRLDIIQTRHQETDRGFDHTGQLAFLFQARVFQLVWCGSVFQPAHITAVFRRDDVGGFRFGQCRKVGAFSQLVDNRLSIGFSFGLNDAVTVTLRLSELILVLVVVRLYFAVRRCFRHRCGIQLDVAHTELLRCGEVVFVLLVVGFDLVVAD
ncbi:hypothetical protein D3C72_1258250 [compost metagenome]